MLFRQGDEDTICALSTPPGNGGIAVLRVSGPRALEFVEKSCRFLPKTPESHRVFYGLMRSIGTGEIVDEVLVTFFAKGRSYTGEETLEISCHGGQVVTANVLKELLACGCRLARRGEFTYRAFMNGRLDLVQAESVLALIESQSSQSAKISLRQLQGSLSGDFVEIEDSLVWILAHLEASIDFSSEDIEVVDHRVLLARVNGLIERLSSLVSSYRKGRLLKEGLEVALIGRPNAGKSSLLNSFLGEDRAIVSAQPGTTRDTIEGRVTYGGLPVTFVDTAGLRETSDEIEKIGVERSKAASRAADFVLHVVDSTDPIDRISESLDFGLGHPSAYWLVNKVDHPLSERKRSAIEAIFTDRGIGLDKVFWVSAKTRQGLGQVEDVLASIGKDIATDDSSVVTQARHLELLQKIHSCLLTADRLIRESSSPEFIAFELQEAVHAIHELLGKEFDEQVIDRIFKEFCLGK